MFKYNILNLFFVVFLWFIGSPLFAANTSKFITVDKVSYSLFDVGGSISAVPATCSNNGSINATASGGLGNPKVYIFTLTNGPTTNGQTYPTVDYFDSVGSTFDDLYPGTYEVTIEDANDSNNTPYIQTIAVLDETQNLNFSLTPTPPNCPSTSTGAFEVNISSGTGPYQYQIFTGPSGTTTGPIADVNQTYTFSNLPAGNYSIRVYDGCGDFQTRSFLLSDPTLRSLNLYSSGNPPRERISCTDAIYKVGGSGGTGFGTYIYEVVGGAPLGYSSNNTDGQFTLPINMAPYTLRVTDACGQTANFTHSNPNSSLSWTSLQRNCSDWSLRINPKWMVGPYVFTLTNTPVGYSGPVSNTTGIFNNIPYGSYSYSVTDSCGLIRNGSTTRRQEPITINDALINPTVDNCLVGTGMVRIRYNNSSNGAVGPVSFELTSVPTGFTGNLGPQNSSVFSELTAGNYVVTASDSCGNTDTYAFEIIDVLEVTVNASVILGCVNSNSIEVNVNSNNSSHNSGIRRYRLRNANTGSLIQSVTGSSSSPYTFNNLFAGEYYVDYYASGSCIYSSETVTISNYEQPLILPLSSYNCGAGLVTISGVVAGGRAPYTFTLINTNNSQVIATSTDCYFSNQDASLTYSVRIEDDCGNTTSSQVSSVINGLGLSFQNESCGILGETFPTYLRNYRGMTYSWTFPDGTTFSGYDPRAFIGVIQMSDFGLYTVDVSTADGCRTQTLSTNFERCPLPPSDIDFDGVDDYLDVTPFITNWTAGTVMGWVKIEHSTTGTLPNLYSIAGQENMRLYITKARTPAFYVVTQDQITASSNFPSNNIQVQPDPSYNVSLDNDLWYHLTGVFSAADQTVKLYVNGKLVGTTTDANLDSELLTKNFNGSPHIYSTREFTIGRYPTNTSVAGFGHLNGNIDEVRIFNSALTDAQIQQMVYQEIENNSGYVRGSIIPKDIEDLNTGSKVSWNNLQGYYPMTDIVNNKTIDYSGNLNDVTLHNITTVQDQTAPMPYATINDGVWTNENTWLHGNVWDIDDITDNKDWSIVHIQHDVIASHEAKSLGLIIDSGKTLTVNSDNLVQNSWYFELNGTLDLIGDSQLIQTPTSDLVTSSSGKILRRQEGASNPYRYNYWSSPVGAISSTALTDNNSMLNNTNNSAFSLNMLKDASGLPVQYTTAYDQNGFISNYWFYTYINGVTYWNWKKFDENTPLAPGLGYTQKGGGSLYQYIFEGKPNNGTILLSASDVGGSGSIGGDSKTEYLLGNPYPSAIDAHQFIADNATVISGTIYLWEQWAGSTHVLRDYQGGYATLNLMGKVRAYQFIGLDGDATGYQGGSKIPTQFIPVAQSFMVEIIASTGNIVFNNGQRIFKKEAIGESVFFKSETSNKKQKRADAKTTDSIEKIKLEFTTNNGLGREMVLGFSDLTTDGFDYGYDAMASETFVNDLTMTLNNLPTVIQGFSNITPEKVIDLNFQSDGKLTYAIEAKIFTGFPEHQEVYLLDNQTENYHDLKLEGPYEFSSVAGIFNDRFKIVFQKESNTLSTEGKASPKENLYYQNKTNTFFAKELGSHVSKLSLINMRGQVIFELHDVSNERLTNGIQIKTISTGTYIICLRTEANKVLTKKIVVN